MNDQPNKPGAKIILVVDDNPVILKTMSVVLKSKGYQVSMAQGGPEAFSLVHNEKPDLILLDLSFPPDLANVGGPMRDGFQILEWLRHTPEVADTPVIIISGTNPEEYQDRATAAGVVACFKKPLNKDEVLAAVQQVLNNSSGQV